MFRRANLTSSNGKATKWDSRTSNPVLWCEAPITPRTRCRLAEFREVYPGVLALPSTALRAGICKRPPGEAGEWLAADRLRHGDRSGLRDITRRAGAARNRVE